MDESVKIVRVDGISGIIKWKTILPTGIINSMGLWNNRIIVHCSNKTYCLDTNDGNIIWTYNMSEKNECTGSAYLKIMDGYAILVASNCDAPQHTYQRLIKININTGKEEEVIRFNRNIQVPDLHLSLHLTSWSTKRERKYFIFQLHGCIYRQRR